MLTALLLYFCNMSWMAYIPKGPLNKTQSWAGTFESTPGKTTVQARRNHALFSSCLHACVANLSLAVAQAEWQDVSGTGSDISLYPPGSCSLSFRVVPCSPPGCCFVCF
ncbi:hypothetical protein ABBQ32_005498 [Trebouxia sp. C0010 RCD-2024]